MAVYLVWKNSSGLIYLCSDLRGHKYFNLLPKAERQAKMGFVFVGNSTSHSVRSGGTMQEVPWASDCGRKIEIAQSIVPNRPGPHAAWFT